MSKQSIRLHLNSCFSFFPFWLFAHCHHKILYSTSGMRIVIDGQSQHKPNMHFLLSWLHASLAIKSWKSKGIVLSCLFNATNKSLTFSWQEQRQAQCGTSCISFTCCGRRSQNLENPNWKYGFSLQKIEYASFNVVSKFYQGMFRNFVDNKILLYQLFLVVSPYYHLEFPVLQDTQYQIIC